MMSLPEMEEEDKKAKSIVKEEEGGGKTSEEEKERSSSSFETMEEVVPVEADARIELEGSSPIVESRWTDPIEYQQSCKVFIGGLSWMTSETTLRAHFCQYGFIVDAVVMRNKTTLRSRGFGFVSFDNPAPVQEVLSRQHYLDNRLVECKRAVPKLQPSSGSEVSSERSRRSSAEGSWRQATPGAAPPAPKLYVGGVPITVPEPMFREYFAGFGSIHDIAYIRDRYTGGFKGYGFVTYLTPQTVERVLSQSHSLGGSLVSVRIAENQYSSASSPENSVTSSLSSFDTVPEVEGGLHPGRLGRRTSAHGNPSFTYLHQGLHPQQLQLQPGLAIKMNI